MSERTPLLILRDLRYRYPDGTPALDGLDLEVYEGERLGLVGANGAGKSTLLLHLNGVLRGEGDVRVDGLEVDRKTLPRIRELVGLMFQNPDDQLFSTTVFDDVAFGPLQQGTGENELERRVHETLAAVGLEGFGGRTAYHLSLGEKKRVALATILVMNPRLLVLDEPTSGLDPRGRREIAALLRELPVTQVIASHDLTLVRELCDRVAVLHRGTVAAVGEPEAILSDRDFLFQHGLA